MTDISFARIDRRTRRNIIVLILMQAILGAQMPMIFITAGLAGQSLAANACFATLPITLIVAGSMLTATPMSAIMQRYGRRVGFFIGAIGGAIGATIGAYGLYIASFPMFLTGSLFTGIYMSAQGFFRFAAMDTASEAFRARAVSYVMAAGLASAVIGPQLIKVTSNALAVPFLGAYITVIAINFVGAVLFLFLDLPKPERADVHSSQGRTRRQLIKTPLIAVSIISAMVAYALMNLVMTSTPLAVVGVGHTTNNAADIVMVHVLAMYIPSFFTGNLVSRFGPKKITAAGLGILALAGIVGLSGTALGNFYLALALLGIGWNFGFIGATTMLASGHTPQERGRIQGLNDFMVFGLVTIASLASGGLMNCSGGSPIIGWYSVNLAMGPFLILATGALIWLMRQPKTDPIATTTETTPPNF